MGWLLVLLSGFGGCGIASSVESSDLSRNTVVSNEDAWQLARSSRTYQDALQRVVDVTVVRLSQDRIDEEGHVFRVWEDMKTHASTLEWLLVDPDGVVHRFDSVEAQWVQDN